MKHFSESITLPPPIFIEANCLFYSITKSSLYSPDSSTERSKN